MVAKRRKKSSRQQGSITHGWGRNKHRGSGSRGGYGNAGTGKKCDGKKPSIWKDDYFGKQGFVSKGGQGPLNAINLKDVEDKIPNWIARKEATQSGGIVTIDLTKLGYDKLLSTGSINSKVKITIAQATAGAQEKIKTAGGELVVKA